MLVDREGVLGPVMDSTDGEDSREDEGAVAEEVDETVDVVRLVLGLLAVEDCRAGAEAVIMAVVDEDAVAAAAADGPTAW